MRKLLPTRPQALRRWLFCVALAVALPGLLASAGARAETWFADAAQPDDSADGRTWTTAKRTVSAALDASAAGDTILVKYGVYPLEEALVLTADRRLTSDDGTHLTWDDALPDDAQCTLAADGTCRVLTISGAAVSAATCVRGFSLTGGDATSEGDPNNPYGGGVDISGGAVPVLEHCRIHDNLAGHTLNGRAGGLSIRGAGTAPTINWCRIDNNTATTSWFAYGGGVYCDAGTAPVIHDCAVVGNRGSTGRVGHGGGIACQTSNATIRGCEVTGNIAATESSGVGGRGGGLYIFSGNTVVQDCVVTGNAAAEAASGAGYGGGIYCEGGSGVQILDNPAITGNVASVRGRGEGGGICTGGGPRIEGNLIADNTASTSQSSSEYYRVGSGGGVKLADRNTEFVGNLVPGNRASAHGDGYGGGIYFESSNTIERNVIQGNVAGASAGYGGGVYTGGGYHTSFRNNTLVANANVLGLGGGGGSGFFHGASGLPYVENNIFCGHDLSGSDGVAFYSENAMTIDYNGFHDNAGGDVNALVVSQQAVAADPCFVDPGTGDFTLRYDSPCIEAGNPATTVPEHGAWRVDLGAYEYTGTRHWRAIAGAGEYLFGGRVKAKVNLVAAGTVTAIDMVVHPGEHHPEALVSVARYYEITAAGGGSLFDLTLSYLEVELAGADEDSLALWRRLADGWDGPQAPIAADPAANWLTAGDLTDFGIWIIKAATGVVGVPQDGNGPPVARLAGNTPNPFNPATRIVYQLPQAAVVHLAIHDAAGRLVRVLVDGQRSAGEHHLVWDGRLQNGDGAASGLYFCVLQSGEIRDVRKMLLAR